MRKSKIKNRSKVTSCRVRGPPVNGMTSAGHNIGPNFLFTKATTRFKKFFIWSIPGKVTRCWNKKQPNFSKGWPNLVAANFTLIMCFSKCPKSHNIFWPFLNMRCQELSKITRFGNTGCFLVFDNLFNLLRLRKLLLDQFSLLKWPNIE